MFRSVGGLYFIGVGWGVSGLRDVWGSVGRREVVAIGRGVVCDGSMWDFAALIWMCALCGCGVGEVRISQGGYECWWDDPADVCRGCVEVLGASPYFVHFGK